MEKIAQLINLFTDKALAWVSGCWTHEGHHNTSCKNLLEVFQRVFDHSPTGKEMGGNKGN